MLNEGRVYLGHLGPIPLYVHWSFLFLVLMAAKVQRAMGVTIMLYGRDGAAAKNGLSPSNLLHRMRKLGLAKLSR